MANVVAPVQFGLEKLEFPEAKPEIFPTEKCLAAIKSS